MLPSFVSSGSIEDREMKKRPEQPPADTWIDLVENINIISLNNKEFLQGNSKNHMTRVFIHGRKHECEMTHNCALS